jgi:hypothetical protein
MSAIKEFRRLNDAGWKDMMKSYREAAASVARYRASKPRPEFFASLFFAAQPKFTRLWFDLLEWVLIMGALRYLYNQTQSTVVLVVFWVSLTLFALYVPVAVGRFFMFYRFPFIKSLALIIFLSMGISAASGFGVFYLLKSLVYEIAKHHE